MIQRLLIGILLLSAMSLVAFRHGLGPRVVELGFEKEEDGTDAFLVDLTAHVDYDVVMLNPKTMVISFKDDTQWMTDMTWQAGENEKTSILASYHATPHQRYRNRWKIMVKFRKPVDVLHHNMELDPNTFYDVEGYGQSLQRLRVAVRPTGKGQHAGGVAYRRRVRPSAMEVQYLKEFVDGDGQVRIVMRTSIPIDFDATIDASGKRVMLEGPGELVWDIDPIPDKKYTILKNYKIHEDYSEGKDALELIFKHPVKLESASVVGSSFVVVAQMFDQTRGVNISPENILAQQYAQQRQDVGGSVKEVVVHELTDVTHVDFHLTDLYEGKAILDANGDIVVNLPYTEWDDVDVDEFVQRGLFVGYSIIQMPQINMTKVRLIVQKGARILEVQNVAEKGQYKFRVTLDQDPSYESPEWLANYGVRALPLTNAEKVDLQTRALVYDGGVSEKVSMDEHVTFGADFMYSMGDFYRKGATIPVYKHDEPTMRLHVGIPVFSNGEVKLVAEVIYGKTFSSFAKTMNLVRDESFFDKKKETATLGDFLLAAVKFGVPVGAASLLYGRASFGTSWFLHYMLEELEVIKPFDAARMFALALGLDACVLDRLVLGVEFGYQWAPHLETPRGKKPLSWNSWTAAVTVTMPTTPMSGPSALSSLTHVNGGFYLDGGVQAALADFRVAEENQKFDEAGVWRDKRHMLSWRLGMGYLFVQNRLALSAEAEVAARDVRLSQMMKEENQGGRLDLHVGWDVGLLLKPGFMINHGVRAYVILGGLHRWFEQKSGIADESIAEEEQLKLLTKSRKYGLQAGTFGLGLDVYANANTYLTLSYAYNVFPEHRWIDHKDLLWKVILSESIVRMQLGYNF